MVSETLVYRLLKAHDLVASPDFIVMKAADEFKDKTTAPNQLWQTDFTYLKVFWLGVVLPMWNYFRRIAGAEPLRARRAELQQAYMARLSATPSWARTLNTSPVELGKAETPMAASP